MYNNVTKRQARVNLELATVAFIAGGGIVQHIAFGVAVTKTRGLK